MAFNDWDEVRTAFQVARLGTVSGAAQVLGVHHATVIRHIDSLEGKLGAKLFQRHARGYTPTEAGLDLLTVAQSTDDQLAQLANRIRGRGNEMTGELIITSLAILAPLLSPALAAFREEHPELTIKFLTDERVFRLEYGEAHVAIRAGNPPDQPDNVVQKFYHQGFALYASKDYIAKHGRPDTLEEVGDHMFIGSAEDVPRAPFFAWLKKHIPERNIGYRVNQITAARPAVLAGLGIGFSTTWAEGDCGETEMIFPPRPEWNSQLWLVTHVDLHRTAKVQTFLAFLKDWSTRWPVLED
ncbi:MAG: LysR family transcriptional regulator [Jannaschia helgolandensis]|jgi:DNA-binding transcriptional LysR family regulator|uniref:Transcriptional regulator, LysR family n=1 Tax=Jannaschia helgolandensis TaxID=188906 RepID=A0A1H7ICB4_9RHOB|nr:LysR family transcriptional regulator [Jannaschia helgolandensis]SEK59964.1 transcriptional regulator, LysR family [Jannaschia helgolandensis]|tara:strand:- start:796 stop:1689 length:894 start_codon:yes stop_codon:yes gene_type:complete